MDYLELIRSIDLQSFNVDFADMRIEDKTATIARIQNNDMTQAYEENNAGVFIRIYKKGRWYYTSLYKTDKDSITGALKDLADYGRGEGKPGIPFWELIEPSEAGLMNNVNKRHAHSIKEKTELIKNYNSIMEKHDSIKVSSTSYIDKYSALYYANSAGSSYSYDFYGNEVRLGYTMVKGSEQFDGHFKQYGDEFSQLHGLEDSIEEEIEETSLFVNAPKVEAGEFPVILSPDAAGVFAHESFGHKSEADFMLGDKKMREEWKIGKEVGSKMLSIVDTGLIEGTSGYAPFDDEGTPGTKTYLIKNGILSGRLHSLITASALEEKPTGNGRAITTEFEPIVRMTSTFIEEGDSTFDELVSGIDKGVYIKKIKHGSGLSTFTIAPLKSYMIRDGKLAEPVKVNVITGNVFKTLNLIDGLSDELRINSSLMGGCGKMEQFPLRVSFGGPEVRVSKMNVN